MSRIIGVLGSVWVSYSAFSYTSNLIILGFVVVGGFLAWKIGYESLKKKSNGDN